MCCPFRQANTLKNDIQTNGQTDRQTTQKWSHVSACLCIQTLSQLPHWLLWKLEQSKKNHFYVEITVALNTWKWKKIGVVVLNKPDFMLICRTAIININIIIQIQECILFKKIFFFKLVSRFHYILFHLKLTFKAISYIMNATGSNFFSGETNPQAGHHPHKLVTG